MKNKTGNRISISILIILFIGYNYNLYIKKTSAGSKISLSDSALKGQEIWQDNNCTACHQLYGLGGYLGPDLTNIASNPEKGTEYAKAFFNSGIKSMPKFNFNEDEKNNLALFLKEVDQTGYYPNKDAEFNYSGWVDIKYK
jgi:nitric oxide reductase subunit C